MKKSFFLLGVAVAAMTSCSNDEMLEQIQPVKNAIGFESFVNKGTKADAREVTANTLKQFYVYGYHDGQAADAFLFDNVEVNLTDGEWIAKGEEQYWETQNYQFAAYADGAEATGIAATFTKATTTPTVAPATLKFTDYTISTTQAEQKDLIAALYTRDNTNTFVTTDVDFEFNHLLSKVIFKFENTNTDKDLSMVITGVELNVKNKATCSYNSSGITWEGFADDESFALAQPKNVTNVDDVFGGNNQLANINKQFIIEKGESTDYSLEYFVIPGQEIANISFHVAYYDASGALVEEYNKTISLFPEITVRAEDGSTKTETISWVPSYIYQYNVQLPASPKPIKFGVANVGGWQRTSDIPLDGSQDAN